MSVRPATSPTGQYQSLEPNLPPEEQPTLILPITSLPVKPVSLETAASQRWYGFPMSQASALLPPLQVQQQAFTALRLRLRAANKWNRQFKNQFPALEQLLREAVDLLRLHFASIIDQVVLTIPELLEGTDLRKLGYGDIYLTIVLRIDERPYWLYRQIAAKVFSRLDRSQFLPQFSLVGASEWREAVRAAVEEGNADTLGTVLLRRL